MRLSDRAEKNVGAGNWRGLGIWAWLLFRASGLVVAAYLIVHIIDSRDQGRAERLPYFDNEQGTYRCHAVTNCVEACPKELSPIEGIQWLKRAAVRRRVLRQPK